MPNPLPIELRERAVRAYADGTESCEVVAERLSLNPWTLLRWIGRQRETGSVAPLPRGGGRVSPVDISVLETVVRETRTPDPGTTREYTPRGPRAPRHRRASSARSTAKSV